MKTLMKLLLAGLLLAGCGQKNNNGIYVNHAEGQYSIADDTLIVADTVIINHTGYQKKRNRQILPKAIKKRRWNLPSPDAPVIQFKNDKIVLGQTIYTKLP